MKVKTLKQRQFVRIACRRSGDFRGKKDFLLTIGTYFTMALLLLFVCYTGPVGFWFVVFLLWWSNREAKKELHD